MVRPDVWPSSPRLRCQRIEDQVRDLAGSAAIELPPPWNGAAPLTASEPLLEGTVAICTTAYRARCLCRWRRPCERLTCTSTAQGSARALSTCARGSNTTIV